MFRLTIEHTKDTCLRLAKAQEECFGRARLIIRLLLAGLPVGLGFAFGLDTVWGLLLFLFGIYLYYNTSFMYEKDAEAAYQATPEQFRTVEYVFTEDGIQILSGGVKKNLAYKDLRLLATDDAYVYLFINSGQAYMGSLSGLTGKEYQDFKAFLAEKTSLTWKKVKGRLTFSQSIHKSISEMRNRH